MRNPFYPLAWLGVALFSLNLSTPSAQAKSPEATLAKSEYGSYIVLMEESPAIYYEGGIQGYRATKSGKNKKINAKSAHVRKYTKMLNSKHDEVLSKSGVAKRKKVHDYNIALNGFAARMSYEEALKVAKQKGVIRVFPDELGHTTTDNTPTFLGLNAADGPWSRGYDGEGIVVGVIDTGIWPEHPSFADDGTYPAPAVTLDETVYSACDFGNSAHNPDDAAFTCNNKLIGARQINPVYRSYCEALPDCSYSDHFDSARDDSGHGTHTAGTAAGNADVPASILGRDFGVVSGIAPRAQIIAYKSVGGDGTGFTSDCAAAIDQAVADGVDVINYSNAWPNAYVRPDGVAFLFAGSSGVFVAAANANWGPGPATVGAPASVPWLTSVGASTQDRIYQGSVSSADGWEVFGAAITAGTPDLPLVDAAEAGDERCAPGTLDATVVAGKIVLCLFDGTVWPEEQSLAVSIAGGGGMIWYGAYTETPLFTDTHHVPTIQVRTSDGLFIKGYIANTADPRARITAGEFAPQDAPFMARFSSRGPNVLSRDLIKPDVTAPGVNVLAGVSPVHVNSWPLGELFAFYSGTSMATPHVAGLLALLKQAHPDWTPAMAKSALMTTAYQAVNKEDNATPADPFDMGAGHVNPGGKEDRGSPFDPGLAYDAGLPEYTAFTCGRGLNIFPPDTCAVMESLGVPSDASNLNLPSLGIGDFAGTETLVRTVTSVANEPGWRSYSVDVNPPPGYEVTVSPSSISLEQGISATYEVTITNAGAPGGEWRFGSLSWSDSTGDYMVRSPIAVRGSLLDSDGDGVLDATDNCVDNPNPTQDDADTDGIGDACDSACADGLDNDGDGFTDFVGGDPGCFNDDYLTESPQCQDGIDNDGDGKMDYDAGLSANGFADPAGPDSYCVGSPWVNIEALPACGLGTELALVLAPLLWLYQRRRQRV